MSVGNLKDQGNKGNNFPYQVRMLKLLAQIDNSINAIPGVDFVTRTTTYQATAPGPGYVTSNILVRYDIIDIVTGLVTQTIWFNQNTQLQLPVGSPIAGTYVPITPPSTVFVGNGALGAAVNIQDGGNSITVDDGGTSLTIDGSVTLLANSGVDIGDVTVNNTGGSNAVNIQDGGNSITVDDGGSSLSVNDAGGSLTVDSTNLDIRNLTVTRDTVKIGDATHIMLVNSDGSINITDNGGSLTVDGTVAATQSGTWNINNVSGTVSLPTGAATETTLSALNSQFTQVTRTPGFIRATGAGTVAAGARSASFYNAGLSNGTVLGQSILPGEILNFSAGGENDVLSAISYSGVGTTLVITTIV